MKRRSVLIWLTALNLANPAIVRADPTMDALQQASVAALQWFKVLMVSIKDIVETQKRNQLREAFADLGNAMYAVEKDKELLLSLIVREPADFMAIRGIGDRLTRNIEKIRQELLRVGPLLRQQYASQGVKVEQLLSEAMMARKMWVGDLSQMDIDRARKDDLIVQGKAAIKALREAHVALSELITRI